LKTFYQLVSELKKTVPAPRPAFIIDSIFKSPILRHFHAATNSFDVYAGLSGHIEYLGFFHLAT